MEMAGCATMVICYMYTSIENLDSVIGLGGAQLFWASREMNIYIACDDKRCIRIQSRSRIS